MDCCKLLVIATVLLFGGVFGQLRFQRHLDNATTTQNGLEQGFTGINGLSHDGELVSDNDYTVVLDKSGETVEIELLTTNGELRFEMCPNECMGTQVAVCYEAGRIDDNAKGVCAPNQCEFVAGAYEAKTTDADREIVKKIVWFMNKDHSYSVYTDNYCPSVAMKFGNVVFYQITRKSCDPVKRDGKIVTLHVRDGTTECPLKVINAKRWFPTTTASPTTAPPPSLSTPASKSNETGSSTSTADTTWWIVGGILAGFFVLLIIGVIGFCVYRHHQQKKAAAEKEKADKKRQVISPESLRTLDLSPYIQKEEEKPKKEEIKKDKTEQKKKVEVAPAKVLPSKEPTTEDRPKVEPSKEQAAPEIKEVQKGKKAAPANECSKKIKKHVKKDVVAAAPPPPPRQKPSTTQEESPSIEKQVAVEEDGSLFPSIEKKPASKKPAKKMPLPRSPHRRQHSKKAPTRRRSYLDTPQYGMSTEEWK